MDLHEVCFANSSPQLSKSFYERSGFDVSDGSPKLNDTNFWCLIGIINRYYGNSLNPILDGVREMGYHLNRFPEVISFPLYKIVIVSRMYLSAPPSGLPGSFWRSYHLFLDHMLVNLPSSDIVLPGQRDVEVSFVVS